MLTLLEKLNICKRMARGHTVTLLSKEYEVRKLRNKVKLKQFALKLDGRNSSTKRCTMKSAIDTILNEAFFMV